MKNLFKLVIPKSDFYPTLALGQLENDENV